MKTTYLPGSSTKTTALGFGCAYLTGGFELSRSRRLVDIAYETGVRHFDVAPLYGIGTAEDVLGTALRGKRDQVTIASKVGRPRPNLTLKTQLVRLVATPVRRLMPRMTQAARRSPATETNYADEFKPAQVKASVDESLRRLKTDYLDLLLLHEATADVLSDELMVVLSDLRKTGKTRAIGVASELTKIEGIHINVLNTFDVFQYSSSILDRRRPYLPDHKYHITHRSIMGALRPIQRWLKANPVRTLQINDQVGVNLSDEKTLSAVLIAAGLVKNPNGIVLAASRRSERVYLNSMAADDLKAREAACKLIDILESEVNPPQPDA